MSGGSSHEYPQFTQAVQPPTTFMSFPFTTTTIRSCHDPSPSITMTSSESDILNLRGSQIISLNASAPIYTLSAPCNIINSEIILSTTTASSNEALYKLEYLGDRNALYIRPADDSRRKDNVYPGFGELKYGHGSGLKSMGVKTWAVRYGTGKDTVLTCRDGKWIEYASGQAIAIERQVKQEDGTEEEELEFLVESDLPDRGGLVQRRKDLLKGLVVVAWVGRCWHSGTYFERNEKESEIVKGSRRASSSSKTSVGRRNTNRFLGNLFAGV